MSTFTAQDWADLRFEEQTADLWHDDYEPEEEDTDEADAGDE